VSIPERIITKAPAYRKDRGQNKKELWKSSRANLKAHEKEKGVIGPSLGTSQNTKKVVLERDARLTDLLSGTKVMGAIGMTHYPTSIHESLILTPDFNNSKAR
jgi:hypothetical protein